MRFNDEDVQAIAAWLNDGGTLELPPKRKEIFLRAQKAYQRLLEFKSDKVTMQHLKADYGEAFNERTCRRDLAFAKQLFGYRSPGSWEFTSGMIIDWCLEMMAQAAKDRDRKGWSSVATILYKFAGGATANERPFDPEQLANPVPREIVIDPRLTGAKEDPLLQEKLTQLLGEKRMKGISVPGWTAEDADFEMLPPQKPEK
jgi:hypothetical protein